MSMYNFPSTQNDNFKKTFTIPHANAGTRLDKFLHKKLVDVSRSQIQKQIKAGLVMVNNKSVPVHYFLKRNDVITIKHNEISKPNDVARVSEPALSKTPVPALSIIADTDDFLVINKPAGLLVHEAPGHTEPTLVDLVLKKYPQIAKIGEDPMRPGLVHRLDREVSGLIIMAKTQDMFDLLKKQFKSRQIKKEYTALVHGAPQKPEGKITFNIDRSETTDYKMAAVPVQEERGRKAVTGFEVIERLGNYTLLNIRPQTGRTHQIRVHLNAYGMPIVGDKTYKPKKLKAKIKMNRIFLHAHYLGFKDLNGEWRKFTVPLPNNLQDILAQLKKK